MFKSTEKKKSKLTRLLENGNPVWVIYLDIEKFHEVEFRHGIKTCKRILEELELEIRTMLHQQSKLFLISFLEGRGGDDFVVYLAPSRSTPWKILDAAEKWISPLENRLYQRVKKWVNEKIRLRHGIVLCSKEPGRSADYLLYAAVKEAFLLNKAEPDPQYFARSEEIKRLIKQPESYLHTAFQPILQVRTNEIFGFEALSRLTESTAFPNIGDLFPFAEKIGQLYPIETLCRRKAVNSASKVLGQNEVLFLNINPQVLSDPEFASGKTRNLLIEHGLHPSNVVLEITERSAIEDFSAFRQALSHYRSQGYLIALDDVGAGYSSLQSIAELHPDFLKIDRSLIAGVNSDPIKWALLETFVTFSKRIGCRILAEGVETAEELRTTVQLGVDYVQGFFLAKPNFQRTSINQLALELVTTYNTLMDKTESAIHSLVEPLPLFEADTKVNTIESYFRNHPNEWLTGVVESGQLAGIIQRDRLFAMLGSRYGVSLYENRPISSLMDPNPLMVEDSTPIEVVSSLAMDRPHAQLYEGIVVVNQQKPVGMVSIAALMKTMADRQIQIAQGANPLTGLPGNLRIDQELRLRLEFNEAFGVIYADLNEFKHYNDSYGFEQGDKAIKLLAEVLVDQALKYDSQAFIGHVGGDDFIIFLSSQVLNQCCRAILDRFVTERDNLLSASTITLALACLNVEADNVENPLTISEKAARLKTQVKDLGGNAYLITGEPICK